MQIDTAAIRKSTKGFLGLVFTAATLFQIQDVQFFLLRRVIRHPQITAFLMVVFGFAAILHNPQVMATLGIKETKTIETVVVDPEKPE